MKQQLYRHLDGNPLVIFILFVLVLGSAIAVAFSADSNRKKVNQLFELTYQRDQLQADWGRLVLEHSTWTSHNRIEVLAINQLQMLIPAPAEVRVVSP